MNTDNHVDEATAALKGMLGLGTSSSTAPHSSPFTPSQKVQEPSTPVTGNQVEGSNVQQVKKKKGRSGKKKTNNVVPASSNNSNVTNVTNSKQNKKKRQQPKRKDNGTINNIIPIVAKKENENFAWSAFQASPDASKLPIPAFSPLTKTKQIVETKDEKRLEIIDASNEKIEEIKGAESAKLMAVEEKIDEAAATDAEESAKSEPKHTLSETGVNLAAVLATKEPSLPQHYFPQYPTYPSRNNFNNIPPPYNPFPHHQHMPPHQLTYAPPPGYITIQVQVPSSLMPGRQMVVTSPVTGLPVQVVVPDQVPPGAILPVLVPTGPPLHMMPHPPPQFGGNYPHR